MIKDITIGQYYPSDSPIHKLDPRTKLIWTFFYIISLFFAKNAYNYGIAAVILFVFVLVSRVPFFYIVRGMRAIAFLLIFTCIFNLFLTPGEPLLSYGYINITREGLATCVSMIVRISLLIMGSSIMTLTTTPNQLTDGLESICSPLRRLRVPVHELAMMMSIALRFIPILMEETDKIIKAQTSRGADFESGSLIKRARALIPILVPLFISAFRRANDLAMAMEARAYRGGEGRTRMNPLRYGGPDVCAFILLIAYLVAMGLTI